MIQSILVHGLLYAGVLSLLILGSLWVNPRIWIQDLPPALKNRVPPKNPREKQLTLLFAIPMMIIVFLGPTLLAFAAAPAVQGWDSFWTTFIFCYGLNVVFNLMDLVVIDWLIICTLRPKRFVIPPLTQADMGDYPFHAAAFCKGLVLMVVPSALSAATAELILLIN